VCFCVRRQFCYQVLLNQVRSLLQSTYSFEFRSSISLRINNVCFWCCDIVGLLLIIDCNVKDELDNVRDYDVLQVET